MATNQPSTPSHRLPRTSTKLSLGRQEMVNVRAEPYKSLRQNVQQQPPPPTQEPLYTVAGPGPLKRFTVPQQPAHSTHTLPTRRARHSVPPPPPAAVAGPACTATLHRTVVIIARYQAEHSP